MGSELTELVDAKGRVATLKHIRRVSELLGEAAMELIRRANVYDDSKLSEAEHPHFALIHDELAGLTYGDDGYAEALERLRGVGRVDASLREQLASPRAL